MGKLVQRQALTPKQYKRANMAMMVILILCYITYIVVEITNMGKPTTTPGGLLRCGIYAALLVLVVGMYIKLGHEKLCMLTFAVSFLIGYAILVFNNGAIVMILVFPALLGFMIYLNSVVVSIGIGATMIICVIKTISISNSGNTELLGYASLIIAGFFVCIYGSIRSILILIEFSREDRAVIEEEAANRAKVAQTVAEIAEKMDSDFRDMLDNLNTVNNAMASADSAMTNITNSTENTADAVDSQANSTNRIHANLETTNDLAAGANEVTERLNAIIRDGKSLSDQLQMQSDLVDQNISNISDTVDELVRNVQKVHGITESILNISSQTNLLALNASIEAARAGNAGRGFAVVADEIRKLAEETKTSTEQITAIISELTAVTSKTQAGIMASTNSINEQRQKVKEVNTSFTNVEVGMEELKESVLVITSNVQALLEANTEIVDSIQLLSEASQNVSSGTQTCKDTIETAVENLERFSDNVNDTFEQLQVLRETATS